MKKGHKYGTHRVISPKGVLPQPADKLDNNMDEIYDNEILIDVQTLNIDSASFTQISNQAGGDKAKIAEIMLDIVEKQGKHRNPVTGSGGMLLGTVEKIGDALVGKTDLKVGPQIAEHLGLPQVTYLEGIKYEGGNRLVVKKWTEEGYQLLEVETPCVVTVLSSANRPRYMSVRGIVEAYDKQVEVWGFDNISVEESKLGLAGSPTRVFKSFTKGAKSAGKVFELEPAEAADLIVEKLQEKFII